MMSLPSSTIAAKFHSIKTQLGGIALLLIAGYLLFLLFFLFFHDPGSSINFCSFLSSTIDDFPTALHHLAFGLQGSEKTFRSRRFYVESWWRPKEAKGYVFLDKAPRGDLLPWSKKSPPYRINDNISELIDEVKLVNPQMPQIIHQILELFREEQKELRWLIMGDDDTIFFLDNLVHVLSKYDHTKYYYIGYPPEFALLNFLHNFNMGFGGGGIIPSYELAKALVKDMDRCLRTYSNLFPDLFTMACVVDIGVN